MAVHEVAVAKDLRPAAAMTLEQLDDLQRLCSAATPGPWAADKSGGGLVLGGETVAFKNGTRITQVALATGVREDVSGNQDANAAFIAASRSAVPAMIVEIERLRGYVDELESNTVTLGSLEACEKLRAENEALKAELAEFRRVASRVVSADQDLIAMVHGDNISLQAERDALRAQVTSLKAELARLVLATGAANG